jgi:hypothetical protein
MPWALDEENYQIAGLCRLGAVAKKFTCGPQCANFFGYRSCNELIDETPSNVASSAAASLTELGSFNGYFCSFR